MPIIRLSVVLAFSLTSAACAAPYTPSASQDPSFAAPAQPVPASLGPPRSDAGMNTNTATPDKRVTGAKPVRWSRAESASDASTVKVSYTITGRPECSALGRVDVAETGEQVTITVLVGPLPGADCGRAQPQLAAPFTTMVTLAKPLGTREIRDGAAV